MAEYILTTATAVPVGGSVPFFNVYERCCPYIRHRNGSSAVKVKGGTYCKPNRYRVSFHGNVTGVQGLIQLALYLDGERLPETTMSVTASGTTATNSVDTQSEIVTDGCFNTISVRVVTGDAVSVNNANLIVYKEGA